MGALVIGTALLLVSLGAALPDDPYQHARRMQVRPFWPRNTVAVEDDGDYFQPASVFKRRMEFYLALPSQTVFQSVAPDQPGTWTNPSTGANVNLLQQLLKVAPAAVEQGKYDNCNHPFHSWMCNPSQPASRTTTVVPPPEVVPDASLNEEQLLEPNVEVPRTLLPPPPPPSPALPKLETSTKKGWDEADSCSHPFHSWLCVTRAALRTTTPQPFRTAPTVPPPPQQPPQLPSVPEETVAFPEASNPGGSILLPATEPTTTTTTTTAKTTTTSTTTTTVAPVARSTPKKSGWDEGADSCSHAFHSWLCAKPTVRTIPTTTIRSTTPTERTTPPIRPDASNNEGTILVPESFEPPSTTRAPTTTSRPPTPPITNPPLIILRTTPKPSGWSEGVDPCTHAFHSWLCAKPKARPSPPSIPRTSSPRPKTEPVEQEQLPDSSKPEGNVLIPQEETTSTTTTTTTTTTTPRPPPPPPPTPSSTAAPRKGWDEKDSCSHPFHSWLCNKAPGRRVTVPVSTPVPEIQPKPDSSNLGEVLIAEPATTTTTTTTTTTSRPAVSTTPVVQRVGSTKSGWDGQDPCTHPFHSWLCNRAPGRTLVKATQPPSTSPRTLEIQPNPDSSNLGEVFLGEPATTARTTTTSTTSRRPPVTTTDTLLRAKPSKTGWEGQDPCSHPFHSWLCRRGVSASNIPSGPRIQRQSVPVAADDTELLTGDIAAWETLELRRVHPLAKEARTNTM